MSAPGERTGAGGPSSDRTGDAAGEAPARSRTLGGLVGAADGDRPAVTLVDPGGGERTELGCATLSNWADKLAGLLVWELELEAGDDLAVDTGSHWTTLVVLVGAWRAGVAVRLGEADPAHGPAVVSEQRAGRVPVDDDVVVVGAGMAGRHTRDVHGGLSFHTDVLSMPDEFAPPALAPGHPALRLGRATVTHDALLRGAHAAAELLALAPRSRLASARPVDGLDGLVAGPLAAWAAGASLVLAVDPARLDDVAASERADVALDLARDGGPPPAVRCELGEDGAVEVRPA